MLANIENTKYSNIHPDTNRILRCSGTLIKINTPIQSLSNLHVCPGFQCLLIPKLNHVGQAQWHLNGNQTKQQIS